MIQVVNPTTLEVIGEFPIPSQEEIGNILKRLREGNLRWSRKDINQRLEILKNIRRVIINDADRIATTITKNTGKPIFESYSSEILPVCLIIEFFTKTVPDVLSTRHLRLPFFPWVGRKSEVEFRPYGIIGVISPWNFPFLLPMSQILCALACGNCVVFKPSSVTAVVGKLIDEIFREAGIKEDVFCTVIGDATTGTAIIKQKVDKIFFTGSVETGKRIMELCAQNLTPVVLELGGKNPMLVLNDANIDYAVDGAMWGGFTNSGQVCASVERVIVDRKIFGEFVKKLVYKTQKLRQSDPLDPHTDIGSLCCKSQFETVCHLVEDAKNHGARILTGGGPR
jgi:succinate-semialdehyde dehydrogenase/glutarate-semialdehyde dehydrogenase